MTLERTTSGLLLRAKGGSGFPHPWVPSEWTAADGTSIGQTSSDGMPLHASSGSIFTRLTALNALAARGKVMVQVASGNMSTGGAFGVALVSDAAVGALSGVLLSGPGGFTGNAGLQLYAAGAVVVGDTTSGHNYNTGQDDYVRVSLHVDGVTAAAHIAEKDSEPAASFSLTLGAAVTGQPALLYSSGNSNTIYYDQLVYCADRYVKVSGLATGQVAKVRTSDGTVLASAEGSGGIASVDMFTVHLDGTAHDVAVFEIDGTTLVESFAPTGGVWPGDEYAPEVVLTHPPATPTLTVGDIRNTGVDLSGSAFSDEDTGDTHQASQWQVQANGGDWSDTVFDSGTDTVNLLSITATGLTAGTDYEARVRYQDSADEWSSYSTAKDFTTTDEAWSAGPGRPATDWGACSSPPATAWAACDTPPATAWEACP